ncbi:UNVERIFIED_CONTAM: hypothetical protein Slati_2533600 [Sesamum latifolium]|uniref:Uncharacterized protein n=1 Tax=Sesamum latifolium TaxID=2727402 RepID=A0AAW2WIM5_9LAMI
MSTSDESVRFVGESNPGPDPFEATSRMAGSPSAGPSSGRRRNLHRMAAAFRHLIDEEEEKEGSEGEASSPGEGGKNATEIVSVHPPSSLDLGPSYLQTSHITQMREEFFIPDSQIIYTPGPQAHAPFPPANCLAFFLAQVRAGLRFPSLPSIRRWLNCFKSL